MLRAGMIVILLVVGTNPAVAVTKEGCAAEGGEVEPSRRGASWWRCCLKIPSGILRGERSKICFVCDGDSSGANCDQLPYAAKEEKKPVVESIKQDKKKVK